MRCVDLGRRQDPVRAPLDVPRCYAALVRLMVQSAAKPAGVPLVGRNEVTRSSADTERRSREVSAEFLVLVLKCVVQ